MSKPKEIIKELEQITKKDFRGALDSLEEGLELLERIRDLKMFLDDISAYINEDLLKEFKKRQIGEYKLENKVAKTAIITKYNCKALIGYLPDEVKIKLLPLQSLHLNKSIIDKAISLGILDVKSIQEYIEAGLVTKKTKKFIKFSNSAKQAGTDSLYTLMI